MVKSISLQFVSMENKEVREGVVTITAPDVKMPEDGEVFYNPVMEFDRDISVAFLKAVGPKKTLDGLAATGIRGLRYAKEAGCEVTVNDADPKAVSYLKKNARLNKMKLEIKNDDVNVVLRQGKFDFIDIDPFGTPALFFDSSARAFLKRGHAAFTATDTAVLCGVYPEVSRRRYGIPSMKCAYVKELGLRILLSGIMMSFSRYEKAFVPVLAYSRRHYFRVYGEVRSGAKETDKLMEKFGDLNGYPVYMGPLKSGLGKIINELSKCGFRMERKETEFLEGVEKEPGIPFYIDIEGICSKKRLQNPRMEEVVKKLRKEGFEASRTHFSPTGIKTDATEEDIEKMLRA